MALIGKGDCYFKTLTPHELLDYTKELKAAGLQEKSRKVRSDLGKRHVRRGHQKIVEVSSDNSESASSSDDDQDSNSDSDDDNNSHHSKKSRKGKGKRVPSDDTHQDEPSRKKKKAKESDHGKRRDHVIKKHARRSYSPKRIKLVRA
jgi:hypothetical protein